MLLAQICALQKAYGKTPEELETLVEGFSFMLDGFEIHEIMRAMRDYILEKSDIPAPADIVAIIRKNRVNDSIAKPDIETLLRYEAKGLPLSESQKAMIQEHKGAMQ